MKEIEYLQENFQNISMFILDDDLFTFYRPYVEQFCEAYKKISSACPLWSMPMSAFSMRAEHAAWPTPAAKS